MQQTDPSTPHSPTARRLSLVWAGAVVLVVLTWVGAYAMRHGAEKVELAGWQHNYAQAQAVATQADTPMVLLFTADWCGPCQDFKNDVLIKPGALDAIGERFVPVVVDLTSQSSNNPNMAVAHRYGVQSIPTLIAVAPDGEPISEFNGARSVQAFAHWLDGVSN